MHHKDTDVFIYTLLDAWAPRARKGGYRPAVEHYRGIGRSMPKSTIKRLIHIALIRVGLFEEGATYEHKHYMKAADEWLRLSPTLDQVR